MVREGHEDCGDEYEIKQWGGVTFLVSRTCGHRHIEPVRADDGVGAGPVVADYCHCCDEMIRRPGW